MHHIVDEGPLFVGAWVESVGGDSPIDSSLLILSPD
jgi:hypothetical protein